MAGPERLRDPRVDRLFQAILGLRDLDECYRFFYDLCTVAEIHNLAQRFQVAELLHQGRTYEEIARRTGMSSATISRIKRFLYYGADGYRLAIERLQARDGQRPDASAGEGEDRAGPDP
jgi:TrpR-related protein YerC/YecD